MQRAPWAALARGTVATASGTQTTPFSKGKAVRTLRFFVVCSLVLTAVLLMRVTNFASTEMPDPQAVDVHTKLVQTALDRREQGADAD